MKLLSLENMTIKKQQQQLLLTYNSYLTGEGDGPHHMRQHPPGGTSSSGNSAPSSELVSSLTSQCAALESENRVLHEALQLLETKQQQQQHKPVGVTSSNITGSGDAAQVSSALGVRATTTGLTDLSLTRYSLFLAASAIKSLFFVPRRSFFCLDPLPAASSIASTSTAAATAVTVATGVNANAKKLYRFFTTIIFSGLISIVKMF